MTAEDTALQATSSRFEIVGPFTSHEVVVQGRVVPHLTAEPLSGGRIALTLDDRYDVHLSVEEADRVVPFLADCIAVASGYTCHPREGTEPRRIDPFPTMTEVAPGL
jgi:hypothetical protein